LFRRIALRTRQESPRNLKARRLGFLFADKPSLAIGLNLAKLVAVYRGIERTTAGNTLLSAQERAQENEKNDRC